LKGAFSVCAHSGGTYYVAIEFRPDPDDTSPITAPWETVFPVTLTSGVALTLGTGEVDDTDPPWYRQAPPAADLSEEFEVYVRLLSAAPSNPDANILAEDEFSFSLCNASQSGSCY
jgi:hypothetical protein